MSRKGVCILIVPRLYENLSVLHQNTMPDRAYYIPSSGRDEMLVRHRERSDRLEFLSGCDWNFAWYPGIDDLKDLFYLPRRIPAELTCIILNGTAAGKRPVHS